mgnify:CR=1 FL=1
MPAIDASFRTHPYRILAGWSLGGDVDGVAAAMNDAGVSHVHLAVGPALGDGGGDYVAAVQAQEWTLSSTMIGFPQIR